MSENPKTHEEVDVKCICGNDTFYINEGMDMHTFFSYRMGVLKTELTCTNCGCIATPFLTSILTKTSNDTDPHQPMIRKKCPMCDTNIMSAKLIEISQGFFELTRFVHQVKCTNPECPWTLESTASSIHKSMLSREEMIDVIAKNIQAKFTELRKNEMKWTEEEHPCIRPWDQLSDADKRLPLLYAEIAVDSF
jgi:hypothetical protein